MHGGVCFDGDGVRRMFAAVLTVLGLAVVPATAWPGDSEIGGTTKSYHDAWAKAKAEGTAVAYSGKEAGNTRNSRVDCVWQSKGTPTWC